MASKASLVPRGRPLVDDPLGSHLIKYAVCIAQFESGGCGFGGVQNSLLCRADHRAVPAVSDASLGRRAHPLFTLFVLWHSAKKSLIFLKLLSDSAKKRAKTRHLALQSGNINKT
jgi:hypothetical protein